MLFSCAITQKYRSCLKSICESPFQKPRIDRIYGQLHFLIQITWWLYDKSSLAKKQRKNLWFMGKILCFSCPSPVFFRFFLCFLVLFLYNFSLFSHILTGKTCLRTLSTISDLSYNLPLISIPFSAILFNIGENYVKASWGIEFLYFHLWKKSATINA